jgi:hypothetical protein
MFNYPLVFTALSLFCPGLCHSFFFPLTYLPSMKLAGFLSAFAGSEKQSSGLCFSFLLQWGHSRRSLLVLCQRSFPPSFAVFPPLAPLPVAAAAVAATSNFFISFLIFVRSWFRKSFSVFVANVLPGDIAAALAVAALVAAYAISCSVARRATVSSSAEI